MKNAALGNDAVVDVGAWVVSQGDGSPSEAGKDIVEEMTFQEIVEKHKGNDRKAQEVVPCGYQGQCVQQ